MCGIFGVIYTKEKIDEARVLTARDVLAHRGPDDSGLYTTCTNASLHPNVFLTHRRLSIIDLSPAAHQPMSTPDGRYTIVYNGEIYNYREIREQKLENGKQKTGFYSLISDSDTEIILHLYAEYGKDCLSYLRGMFAFAIWDDKEKTLFAARDRFGIKPFYYYQSDTEFIFSSELKAIKHYKGNLTINNDALDAFLRTGSVPAPMTIYNEVHSLLPGHWLECKMVDGRWKIDTSTRLSVTEKQYWSFFDLISHPELDSGSILSLRAKRSNPNSEIDPSLSENDKNNLSQSLRGAARLSARQERRGNLNYKEEAKNKYANTINHASMHPSILALRYDDNAKKVIRNSLLDTIASHLVADVEVGAFLSGGIDSTAIVSLMRQVGKEKIKTVSIVFPESRFDESKYSRLAAKKYNTEHIEIPFYEKDLLDDLDKIFSLMDQPTIDGINTYFVSKAAKMAGLKVVLSGLGGDELFGGYPSFNLIPKLQRIKKLPFATLLMKAAVPFLKNRLPAKAIEYFLHPDYESSEYSLVRGLFTNEELKSMGWDVGSQKTKVKSKKIDGNVISTNVVRINLHNNKISQSPDKSGSFEMTTIQQSKNWDSLPTRHYPLTNDVIASGAKQSLSTLQYVCMMETCNYMANQLLRDSDVFSMAHSIELRVPFVDHLLYEAVLGYLEDGYDKKFPKKMLVEAVGDLPDEIVHRPKMGFTFPFEDWIKNGAIKNEIKDSLKKLNMNFNLKFFSPDCQGGFDFEKFHWSRVWALYILNELTDTRTS